MKKRNKPSMTMDDAVEDIRKAIEFNSIRSITHFFPGTPTRKNQSYVPPDYMAFWNARKEYGKALQRLREYGWIDDAGYINTTWNNLACFTNCQLNPELVQAVFKRFPGYAKILKQTGWLIQPHGRRIHAKKDDGNNKPEYFCNIYSPTLPELKSIFESRSTFEKITNLNSGYYTKRQKHLILVYVLGCEQFKKQPGRRMKDYSDKDVEEIVKKDDERLAAEASRAKDETSWNLPKEPPPPDQASKDDWLDDWIDDNDE